MACVDLAGLRASIKNCGFGFKILSLSLPNLSICIHLVSINILYLHTTLNKAKARFERHSHRGLITVLFEFFLLSYVDFGGL